MPKVFRPFWLMMVTDEKATNGLSKTSLESKRGPRNERQAISAGMVALRKSSMEPGTLPVSSLTVGVTIA
jgi:hypothetical protein